MNHPLMFSLGDDGEHNGNGHYMDGITYKLDGVAVDMAGYVSGFNAATSRVAEILVQTDAPQLFTTGVIIIQIKVTV